MPVMLKNSQRKWGRSPHGERGLKYLGLGIFEQVFQQSLPTRGAWIEISLSNPIRSRKVSLPTRGAWFEIMEIHKLVEKAFVAPHTGSVD